MDNYDEDFEEEIIDESIDYQTTFKNNKPPINKNQTAGTGSQQGVRNQPGRGSMKDTDRKSRNGTRKTVALTKASTKRDSEDHYVAPLKNITNNNKNKNSNSYNDDDIEDEVSPKKRLAAVKSESPKAKNKMGRIKEFDLDALGIKASMDKRSSHSTPRSRVSQVINFSYYERFRDIVEGDIYGKSIKELEGENSKLRDNLKDLNEQLTKIIERARVATLVPKVVEFKNKNVDDKIRTIEKEMNNNKQILEFTVTEYNSLKSKLDKIKNATYVMELEDKIRDAINKTEALKKENKNLNFAAGSVAKDLNHIDRADGMAPALVEANEKAKELVVIKRKLKKVRDMNTDLDEESKTKKSRYEKAQEEYKKLYSDAEQFKVTAEDNKLANKHSQLQAQVKNLEDYIKYASNNNEKYLKNQLERNIEELYVNNMKDRENVERLEGMIDEQKTVLREMIEKEEQKSDRQTLEVIAKIKNSLDTGKFMTEPVDFGDNKPRVKSLTHLEKQKAPPKKNKDIYADLPLYTPNNIKVDPLLAKKDIIKKEMSAIKENARKEDRSRTPEHRPAQQSPDNSKPSLKAKDREANKPSPRVEEKLRQDSPVEEKKEQNEESSNLKPSFSKPNFMKKKEPQETLQLGNQTQSNDNLTLGNNKELTLGGPKELTLGGNQNLSLGGKQNQSLAFGGGNQALTLGGNQNLTLGGGNQNLTLGGGNKELTLGGNQGLTLGGNQNQNLTLGGGNQGLTLGGGNKDQNLMLGGNQNLTLGGSTQNKQPLTLGGNKEELAMPGQPKQELKLGALQEDGEVFEVGGLSRLNRARKGPGGNAAPITTQPKEELSLPGQKPAVGGQLTMPGSEQKNQSNEIWGNSSTQNKQPLTLGGSNTVNNNPFGAEKKEELTIKPAGGRDRSHLTGSKSPEETSFGIKKEVPKSSFEPDDLFGGGNKVENKQEVTNTTGGQLGQMGIPGVRTGRGGVAGRPRQVGQGDDMFGGETTTTKPVPATNSNVGGFGGGFGQTEETKPSGGFGGLGGFGGAQQNKAQGGFGGFGGAGGLGQSEAKKEVAANETLPTEIQPGRRMRMGDNKANVQEKSKNLATKAEKGGFFGDFDD